jgi:DNA-binding transcriptional LysR family regulator
MQLNMRQIEMFRAVMSTGSVSSAAEVLLVSQPSVSRMLAHAEARLGFSLFKRVKGRLHPTPEARSLLREVENVHLAIRRVNKLAQTLVEQRAGLIHVASSPSLGQVLMPEAIAAFRRKHPGVKVRFELFQHENLKEQILNRRVDFGFTLLPMEHPNLAVVPLAAGRIMCVCPAAHALATRPYVQLADLRDSPLISYPVDTPLGLHIDQMYRCAGEELDAALEVGSPHCALALVSAGAGVALVDEFTALSLPASHLVAIPVTQGATVQAHLVHQLYEPLSQLSEAFIHETQLLLQERGLLPSPESRFVN